MTGRRLLSCPAILTIILITVAPGWAADSRASAAWTLYEQGNAAYASGELGDALRLYLEAVSAAGDFPEAELAIGDVYAEEGEPALALRQYEKAYIQRKSFIVPNMQYEALYKQARLYELLGQYGKMEAKLLLVALADSSFEETPTRKLRSKVLENYYERGVDRVLVLYVFEDSVAARAHARLGWYYYRTGRFGPSVERLLFALVYRVSQANRYLHDRDIDYDFTTLPELLRAVEKSADLSRYADETGLYETIYYLAAATYAEGRLPLARQLWTALSAVPRAGDFQALSVKQLRTPFVDPLLVPAGR